MSKLFAPVFVALVVALSFALPALADKGSGGGGVPGELRLEGTVSAVDTTAGTVTITSGGVAVKLTTSATTKVERNGVKATLAAFKLGDRGQARYVAGGAAHKVEAVGP